MKTKSVKAVVEQPKRVARGSLRRMVIWLREIVWAYRVKKCWREAEGDYGQFLGNIGCNIAYGKLPRDILKRAGMSKPDNDRAKQHL